MIDNILDNYYTRKIKYYVKGLCSYRLYRLDLKYEIKNGYLKMFVKKKKYNKKQYQIVFSISKKDSLLHLVEIKDLLNQINKFLDNYSKEG